MVKDELENSAFIVLEAGHGLDAIAMFDDPADLDLLVTNLSMPGADGIAVATAARVRHPDHLHQRDTTTSASGANV